MARFELGTLTDYSDEEILAEVRRVAALHPSGPLTVNAYQKLHPKVSFSTVAKRFGGWKNALEAAGLTQLYVTSHMPYFLKLQRGTKMSDEQLLREMRRVHSTSDKDSLTTSAFNNNSVTHADAVRARFGTWPEALKRAGITQAKLGRRYTDQVCYENIVTLWTHYGRQPQYGELTHPPSAVGPKAYILRWGSWRKALRAFVEWANSETVDVSTDPVGSEIDRILETTVPVRKEEDCREVRPGLRFKVFMRDRFRCVACGRSPATHLNIELHADHIVSVADGGKTAFENLQTLCRDCNLGKGRTSILS
jgi:hypothetical protein